MMKKVLYFIFFSGIISLISISCESENMDNIGSMVELYLIEDFETINNSFVINESTVKTKHTPIITYSDFISYNSSNYTFEISDAAKKKIENLEHSVHGIAFALKVDNVVIYTGYFWPSYSSMSCPWIVTDPMRLYSGNNLTISLGYPSLMDGEEIVDRRNDSAILDVFNRDNKLIE